MRGEMTWRDRARRLSLRLARGSRIRPPLKRPLEIRVAGEKATKTIVFEGKPLELRLS